MAFPPSEVRVNSRPMSRRQVVVGLTALGASVTVGSLLPEQAVTAASGQLPGASLFELATYTGWRRTWDLIVPLRAYRAYPRTALLYDRAAGEATLLAVDEAGGFREVRTFFDWRTTWDIMVPSEFPQTPELTGLFGYDRAAGHVTTLQFDAFGNFQELQNFPNWRKTWTAFVPYGINGLLAYERGSGYATLFNLDRAGSPREIRSYNDWRATWDILTSGPFTTAELPGRDVLLYDRTARQAEGLTLGDTGDASSFADYSGWRQTWTSLHGGLFRFRGFSGSMTADLALFDQNAQDLEFLDIGSDSALVSVLLTPTPDVYNWTNVTPIGPDLLLLYDRPNGVGAFYATDRSPVTQPTVLPAPVPTNTPAPEIIQTGQTNVRLEQGEGNNWHTYTGKSSDPASGGGRIAYITGVKNASNKRIGLIHVDRPGKRTGPVFVKATEVSDAFNGMQVAGDWEARMTGSQSEASPRVTLEVRYEVR